MPKETSNETRRQTQQQVSPNSPAVDPIRRADKLLGVCLELLELCIEVTGTIDPAAAWLVAHAKEEVSLNRYGTRDGP